MDYYEEENWFESPEHSEQQEQMAAEREQEDRLNEGND